MRLSMLAVIAVAIIVGLGVVFAAKHYGWLNPPPPPALVVTTPVLPPVVQPIILLPPMPVVLAPVNHLFMGDAINPNDVQPRVLREEELKEYEANKADYLPAVREIVHYRMPARDLPVDRPLKKGDLLDAKKPDSLHARLVPGTRAIGVSIPKENAAGGLIQVGDWVDVYLITDVSRTDNPTKVPQSALVAPHAQVVAKRDTLYPLYIAPIPGEPFAFTLATNPYRAALIEYGRTVGMLALVPVSEAEKKRLDGLRDEAQKDPTKSLAVTFADPNSPDYKTEQDRIDRHTRGQLSVGPEDLAMALNLRPIEPPLPPPAPVPAPEPPPPPVTVEIFSGVNKTTTASFPVPYTPPPPQPAPWVPPPPAKYLFSPPVAPNGQPLGKLPPLAPVKRN